MRNYKLQFKCFNGWQKVIANEIAEREAQRYYEAKKQEEMTNVKIFVFSPS